MSLRNLTRYLFPSFFPGIQEPYSVIPPGLEVLFDTQENL